MCLSLNSKPDGEHLFMDFYFMVKERERENNLCELNIFYLSLYACDKIPKTIEF